MYKKLISGVLMLMLMLTFVSGTVMASNWAADDTISISVRVFDTKTYNSFLVGTDTITKGDQYIRSNPYKIRPISDFTANAETVEKVTGNWYFPTSDQNVGSTVYFSCNSDTAIITYWVSGYKEGVGTGATKNETVNLGGSGSKTLNYSVVYHSNYPDGSDYKVTVKYTVKSYTASRNMFSKDFKTYSQCSFGGFNVLSSEKTWYTDKSCSTPKNSIYASNNATYDVYAGWKSGGTAAKSVELTCYDNGIVDSVRTGISGESITLSSPQAETENAVFEGWAETEGADTAIYKDGDEFTLTVNTSLYAVWSQSAVTPPAVPLTPGTEGTSEQLVYSQPYVINNNYAYLFGYNDSEIGADETILRGQASAILYRLLKQNNMLNGFVYNENNTPAFADLNGRWDRSGVEFMAHLGIYASNPSANVNVDGTLTRGEAFKMFAIAMGCTNDLTLTSDQYTQILVKLGFVQGDSSDSTDYRTNDKITRAEFCKIYNAIIGRDKDHYKLSLSDGTPVTAETYGFTDMPSDFWAYDIMLKATSSFDDDGYVDLALRELRNTLDDYNTNK